MRPLTEHTPKPLIEVCGKPILQHVIEALPAEVDELVLVVGYLQAQIRAFCGDRFLGRTVHYVEQTNFAGGTGDALNCAQSLLHDRFLFMYADDIHGAAALQAAVRQRYAVLAARSDTPERFGVLEQNSDGTLRSIIEKPAEPPSNLVNIGGFVLDTSIFDYEVSVSIEHGELLVTDMLTAFAVDHAIAIIEQDLWLPIGYPEQISAAEAVFCPKQD